MKPAAFIFCLLFFPLVQFGQLKTEQGLYTVKTANGLLKGVGNSGITSFKGVPFAQPPVGALRWKEPQPVKNWEGTRDADHFSPRAMQAPVYSDMVFRSSGVSEDCLYLNIWTPAKTGKESLPVLVYFYGGGFIAGDGSEYRYDGESMARRGIVSVTVNYRLGVFGFLAHPELTKESPHHASGNYGLMDQTEALRWVHRNIAAFGGNPDNITIAGESAGSYSVCAQVISPLPRNLFSGAIGESGSLLALNPVISRADAEKQGLKLQDSLHVHALAQMREISAEKLLQVSSQPGFGSIRVDVDGYFFPEAPYALYSAGNVARVPLLLGWNSSEDSWRSAFGTDAPTRENYIKVVNRLYPGNAEGILKLYDAKNDSDVQRVATALMSDRSIAFGTWRWAEMHSKLNNPVYRYYFTRARPGHRADINKELPDVEMKPGEFTGAEHSAEIEYALGNLPGNRVFDWQPADYTVSAIMQDYFLNFIKTKNPNGTGLPYWPLYQSWQKDPILFIGEETMRQPDNTRERYLFLEKMKQ